MDLKQSSQRERTKGMEKRKRADPPGASLKDQRYILEFGG